MEIKNNVSKNLLDDNLINEGEWITSINELKNKYNKYIWLNKQNKILIVFLSFLLIFFILLFNINYFFSLSLKTSNLTESEKNYMNFIYKYIIKTLFQNNTDEWKLKQFDDKSHDINTRIKNMNSYIDNKYILFYKKKESQKIFIKDEIALYNKILADIKNNQESLIKYKFLPEELSKFIKDIRIMPILLTLNAIKIYMIDYVYIQTWRFEEEILSSVLSNSSILNEFTISEKELEISLVQDIQQIRESWVNLYLQDIKFNYMYDKLDNSLADKYFIDKFYNNFKDIIEKRAEKLWINIKDSKGNFTNEWIKFIWNYIYLIESIYDKTDELFENKDINQLPVNVNLLSYDPEKQILSFDVEIMLQNQYKAKTSVVEIATNLVSLLRESRLVIGSNIKIDNIKVQQVSENIWWLDITFDKTSLSFNTSVQSKVNVEVTDMNR